MGRRWAWMGMVGVCALLTGCKEREAPEQAAPVSARAPAPARPGAGLAPERVTAATPTETPAPGATAPAQATAPAPMATSTGPGAVASGAPLQTGATDARGTAVQPTELGVTEQAPEGRVMIGLEAVQARDDEAWHQGAARAARAARQNDSRSTSAARSAVPSMVTRRTDAGHGVLSLRCSCVTSVVTPASASMRSRRAGGCSVSIGR